MFFFMSRVMRGELSGGVWKGWLDARVATSSLMLEFQAEALLDRCNALLLNYKPSIIENSQPAAYASENSQVQSYTSMVAWHCRGGLCMFTLLSFRTLEYACSL